jgi:hypothetical protein
MNFRFNRTNQKNTQPNEPHNKNIVFRTFPINRVPQNVVSAPKIPEPNTPTAPDENLMLWGKPTWFLFHTLCEKVLDNKFLEIRVQLLSTLYSICCNLPCPTCAEHAKKHLDGINFNAIQTKEDLKMVFFDFHNYVNSRKHLEIFKYEHLDVYKNAITKNIIYNFIVQFTKKSKNIRYLADDLHRERLSIALRDWFKTNIHYFNA